MDYGEEITSLIQSLSKQMFKNKNNSKKMLIFDNNNNPRPLKQNVFSKFSGAIPFSIGNQDEESHAALNAKCVKGDKKTRAIINRPREDIIEEKKNKLLLQKKLKNKDCATPRASQSLASKKKSEGENFSNKTEWETILSNLNEKKKCKDKKIEPLLQRLSKATNIKKNSQAGKLESIFDSKARSKKLINHAAKMKTDAKKERILIKPLGDIKLPGLKVPTKIEQNDPLLELLSLDKAKNIPIKEEKQDSVNAAWEDLIKPPPILKLKTLQPVAPKSSILINPDKDNEIAPQLPTLKLNVTVPATKMNNNETGKINNMGIFNLQSKPEKSGSNNDNDEDVSSKFSEPEKTAIKLDLDQLIKPAEGLKDEIAKRPTIPLKINLEFEQLASDASHEEGETILQKEQRKEIPQIIPTKRKSKLDNKEKPKKENNSKGKKYFRQRTKMKEIREKINKAGPILPKTKNDDDFFVVPLLTLKASKKNKVEDILGGCQISKQMPSPIELSLLHIDPSSGSNSPSLDTIQETEEAKELGLTYRKETGDSLGHPREIKLTKEIDFNSLETQTSKSCSGTPKFIREDKKSNKSLFAQAACNASPIEKVLNPLVKIERNFIDRKRRN